MFTACHPVLPREARVALALKTLTGLSTEAIARAFLVPTATMAQRIVRAKRTLKDNDVRFEVPVGDELADAPRIGARSRLSRVQRGVRRDGRRHLGARGTVRGGYASRPHPGGARSERARGARAGRADGDPGVAVARPRRVRPVEIVTLLDQDRSRWDRLLITHALAALDRARSLGPGRGWYVLQAEIAACHARAPLAEDTDWVRIASLYGVLAQVAPSPVVELNRAVAVSMADGPDAGLALVDALVDEPALRNYHLLPSVRGDLLVKVGRSSEARAEFERAAAMTANERERELLLARAAECG